MGVWDASERQGDWRFTRGILSHVIAVAFSRDGRSLLSADSSGTVKVWDVPASAKRDHR